ncbi:uncharacterized protein [Clytia hemisphaerica]|uniref:uncharacterized protein isoform X2 n=1 Tax=Clytia hemisphaerica TaxID=252671 RepID=UPI0034D764D7
MKNRLTIHQVFVCIIWIFLQITIAACGNNQCLQSPLNQHRNVSTPFHGPLTVQWSLNPCCQVLHFMVLQHDSLVADLSNPAGNVASLILYQSNYTLIFGMIPHFTIDTYNENQFQINAMFDPYQCYKRNSSEFTSTDDEQILGEEYNLNVTLLFVNYTSGDGNTTLDYTENSYTTQTYIRMSIFLPIPLLVGFLSLLIRYLRKKEKLRRNRKEHRSVIRRMQSSPTTSEQTPDTLTVPHFTSSIKKQPKETKIEIELNKFGNQEMKPKMGKQMLTVPSDKKHAILSRTPNRRLTSSESFNSFHSSRNTNLRAAVKAKRRITYPQVICESIALKELSKYVNLVCTPLVESYDNVITKSSECELDCCKSEINQSSKLTGTFDQDHVMAQDLSVDLDTTFENYTLEHRDIIQENDTPFVVPNSTIPKTCAIKSLIDNGTMRLYKPNQFLIKPIKPNEARDMEFGFFCKGRRKLDERHFTDVDGLLDWPYVESGDAKMTLQRMRSNTL